ncbi:HAMP domain-containing histidine kinase [Marinobacter sp. X15-166B]|uniref:HAMP domain-containing histidine kinase n=1 Tax=Marinobacter sp. X15-166B TaxID=1897620 RepID=UPI00085C28D2|nr:HAMP domain-containing histidine kinase [Marinobacter sp. X15-166B]OEY65802.1 hypothetical protein BG841_04600 [Marinobacter sp. X15-166B]
MTSSTPPRIKQRSLKRRIALITIGSSLATVLLVLLTAYQSLIKDFETLLTREQISASQTLAHAVNQQLERRVQALSSLAAVLTDGTRRLPPDQLRQILERQSGTKNLFSPGLTVFDENATAIAGDAHTTGRIGTNYRDRDYAQRLLKTHQPVISRPLIGRTTGVPQLVFMAPILSDDGVFLGGVGGSLDLSKQSVLPVNELAKRIDSERDNLQIIDSGNMVYVSGSHTGLHLEPLPEPGASRLVDAVLSGMPSGTEHDSHGNRQIFATAHLQRLGWLFVKTTPYEKALAPAWASFQRFFLWSLGGASLLVLFGLWLTRRALQPLNAMTERITHMADAPQTGARLPASRVHELQGLTRAFNALAHSREQKDQQIRAQRDRLELQFQQSGDGILTLDSDSLTILRLNRRMAEMTGYPPETLVGQKPHDSLFAEPTKLLAFLQHVEQDTGVQHAEFKLYDASGSAIEVEISATRLVFSSHAEIMLNLRDATERNMLAALKERFIATLSHELRTPLTAINGALKLLVSGTSGALPDTAQQMAELGLRNGLRLQTLIDDLLDFSKLAAGHMAITLSPCDLQTLLEETAQGNQPLAMNHDVALQLDACGPWLISADAVRLRQILDNFISNAIKASPPGGVVTLAAATQQNRVRISVTDQGKGIPDEFRPFVFQRFAQAETSPGGTTEGTGLGLAICKELAEQMHGTVGYRSQANQGACFWVELPFPETTTLPKPDEPGRQRCDDGVTQKVLSSAQSYPE